MSNPANNISKTLHESAAAENGVYVGTVTSVSVRMGDDTILFDTIRGAMESNPDIPTRWLPTTRNRLRMYLDCVNKLKSSSSLKHFKDYLDEFPFDNVADIHGGYFGRRSEYSRDSDLPVSHQILHFKQGQDRDEFNQRELETAGAITVQLERTKGTSSTDCTTSQFELHFPKDAPAEYMPFLLALSDLFRDRLNHRYDSGTVRSLLTDMLKKDLNAEQVTSSMYLVDGEDIGEMNALSQVFNELHSGIKFYKIHIFRYPKLPDDHPKNDSFRSVSDGVTQALLKDVKEFFEEVKARAEDEETETRAGTWRRRKKEFKELRKRVEKFRQREMLIGDVIDSVMSDAVEVIRTSM